MSASAVDPTREGRAASGNGNAGGVGSLTAPDDAPDKGTSTSTVGAAAAAAAATAAVATGAANKVASHLKKQLGPNVPTTRLKATVPTISSLLPADYPKDVELLTEMEEDEDLKRMLRPASRIASADHKVVPRDATLGYIEDQIKRKRECMNVPFIIMYFVLFGTLLLVHERVSDVSQLERQFRGMLAGTSFEGYESIPGHPVSGHKVLDDVDTKEDIYLYLREAVLPLFFHDLNTTAPDNVYRVLSYSEIIGGIQLQQIRKMKINCAEYYPARGPYSDATGVNPFLEKFDCYPDKISDRCYGPGEALAGFCPDKYDEAEEGIRRLLAVWDTITRRVARAARQSLSWGGSWGRGGRLGGKRSEVKKKLNARRRARAAKLAGSGEAPRRLSRQTRQAKSRNFGMQQRVMEDSPGDIFAVNIYEHEGLQVALDRVAELQANGWIDLQTSLMNVRIFVLHPDLGLYCNVIVNFYFVPSGQIVGGIDAVTFAAEPWQRQWIIAIDVIWAVLWFQLAFTTVHSFHSVYRSHLRKRIFEYATNPFNVIEWLCTMGGFGVLALYLIYLGSLVRVRDDALEVVTHRPVVGANNTEEAMTDYRQNLRTLQQDVLRFGTFLAVYKAILSWYCILLIFRFFKAFLAQPKLAVVTRSIISCAPQFIHFFIVMMTALLSFAVSGMFMFGHRLIYFSSLDMAVEACFLMMMGNFSWEELGDDWPETALFWLTFFMCSMYILILNMALAIIMDVYGAQARSSSVEDSLFDQGETLVQEVRVKGKGVTNDQLLRLVERIPKRQICKQDLLEVCPQLTDHRATYIISRVDEIVTTSDITDLSISDAARLMVAIKTTVYQMADKITQITTSQRLTRQVCAAQKRVRDRVFQATGQKVRGYDPLPVIDLQLDDRAELRLRAIESRMTVIEEFLNEAFSYMVLRGREGYDRLKQMEEVLRRQRDDPRAEGTWDAFRAHADEQQGLASFPDPPDSEAVPPVLNFRA